MTMREVLTVDLGSAYTKIAVRTNWNADSKMIDHAAAGVPETPYCIPSTVARVRRRGADHWQIGAEAAQQKPGEGVAIYENWKAALFNFRPVDGKDASEIATHFFIELARSFDQPAELRNLKNMPVRICIPSLSRSADVQAVLIQAVKDAGWRCCEIRPTVFEPESNLLGLVTRGHNRSIWVSGSRRIQFQAMLELGPLKTAFRGTREGGFGVMTTDIGAFTTDFAYLHFDTEHKTDRWTSPAITQHSAQIGIRDLDGEVFRSLGPEVKAAMDQLPVLIRDRLKHQLYSGKSIALLDQKGKRMIVGDESDQIHVRHAISSFVSRVWSEREAFCIRYLADVFHPEPFTGGGSLISGVSEGLKIKKLEEVQKVRPGGKVATTAEFLEPKEIRDSATREYRERESARLIRTSSAVGACSIFFDF